MAYDRSNFQSFRINLDGARTSVERLVKAAALVVVNASPAAEMTVRFNDLDAGVDYKIGRGFKLYGLPIERLLITHVAQPNAWIDLALWGDPQTAGGRAYELHPAPSESFRAWVDGQLHSTDASAGVALTLYRAGVAYTIPAGKSLYVKSATIVSVPGGDCSIFTGANATQDAGETILRGTVAANGGLAATFDIPHGCPVNVGAWAKAPAGVVDAKLTGYVE